MTANLYQLETVDGTGYAPSSRERVNALIEAERAEWVGAGYDEKRDAYVHYADRILR